MIKRMLIFTIPFAVIGWMVHSGAKGKSPTQGYSYERFAKPNEGKIRAALLDQLQNPDPACVQTPLLPLDTRTSHAKCERCDALVDAGMLSKNVSAITDDNGAPATAVRYELTEAGRPLYAETYSGGRHLAGLCFGHTVIGELELWTAGTMPVPVVDVRYVARIEHPHAVFYGPQARALGLPHLDPGADTLPKAYACAFLDTQGAFTSGSFDAPVGTVNGVPRCSF